MIAEALCVEPDFFLEYRLRQVTDVLDASTHLIDALYSVLLLHTPISDEMKAMLEKPRNGNGNGTAAPTRGRRSSRTEPYDRKSHARPACSPVVFGCGRATRH